MLGQRATQSWLWEPRGRDYFVKEQSHLGVDPCSWWEWSLLLWAYKSLPQWGPVLPHVTLHLAYRPHLLPLGSCSLSVGVPFGPQAAALSPPVYKEVRAAGLQGMMWTEHDQGCEEMTNNPWAEFHLLDAVALCKIPEL